MRCTRWCQACGKLQIFDRGWIEVSIDALGKCVVNPVVDPAHYQNNYSGGVFACGQLGALILVERYLHIRTFDPSTATPEPEYTPAQLAYELNSSTDHL